MRTSAKKGFTIVELLILIVVMGILASITIVAFNGVQQRARAAVVTSDLVNVSKQLALHEIDQRRFPVTLDEVNNNQGIKASNGTTFQYSASADGSTYCITATKGTTSYKISSDASSPVAGGCAGHGVGGNAAITNLVVNPSFETGTSTWSYRWYGNVGGAGTNGRGTNGGYSGTGYMHKVWTVAGAGSDNGFNSNFTGGASAYPVTAGASYTVSGYMRTNRSDYSARTGITWYDSANVVIGSSVYWGNGTTLTANTWQRITQTATAPANAAKAIIYFSNGNSISWAVNDTLSLDAAMFTEGSSVPSYADGSSTNWVWNGTDHASTSTGPAS
jgi:prepilin-type N-terminal cleavage/methylation domain-containing protein